MHSVKVYNMMFTSVYIITAMYCQPGVASDFNSSFLVGEAASADWSASGRQIASGIYEFDVYINGEWRGKHTFWITDKNDLKIKRDAALLIGITDADDILMREQGNEWIGLALLTHGGDSVLNSGQLRVDLTVPQAYVEKVDNRWLPPSLWDPGINGLYSSYNASYYHVWRRDQISDADNFYITLNSGLNLGGWHLIDKSVYRKNRSNKKGYWTNTERYLERPLPSLHSVIRAGESNTGSDWFDSFRFAGVMLKQEQRMYPDIYRTYMPVIQGVARSNATIQVYQNGNLIHQDSVPPGPFEIRDLMPTGSRSDMTVVVQNADGTRESFIVPYSTVSDMLRPGSSEWLLNAGRVEIKSIDNHPGFIQGNFSQGINNYLTLYAGGTLSEDYQSVLGGGAFSVPYIGSFSANVDLAQGKLNDGTTHQGQRYKVSWSRYFPTRTNLTLATYYYDTQDYLSFYDAVKINALITRGYDASLYRRSKQTFTVNLEQPLPADLGKLSLRSYLRTYWQSKQKTREYSLSYSNYWRDINYSIAASRTHYEYDNEENGYYESVIATRKSDESRVDVSLIIPFSIFDKRTNITSNVSTQDGKYTSSTMGISGSTTSMDYSASFTDSKLSASRSGSVYGSWHGPWSKLSGSYTEASEYRQIGASASGTLLFWREGGLASGQTGSTFVILDAPGAANAIVNNNPSVRTNSRGQALVTSASAYRKNNFLLDNQNDISKDQIEIMGNMGHTAPWLGSISYVKYQTDTRKVFIYDGNLDDGSPLPFGASVLNNKKEETGYVAQGSQLYLKADVKPELLYIRYTDSKSNKERLCLITHPTETRRNACSSI